MVEGDDQLLQAVHPLTATLMPWHCVCTHMQYVKYKCEKPNNSTKTSLKSSIQGPQTVENYILLQLEPSFLFLNSLNFIFIKK